MGKPRGTRKARPSSRTIRTRNRQGVARYRESSRIGSSIHRVRSPPVEENIALFSVGALDQACSYCNALHFIKEKVVIDEHIPPPVTVFVL